MKSIIIGDLGTGAYVYFKYLISKENEKGSIVIDEIGNKDVSREINREHLTEVYYDLKDKSSIKIKAEDVKNKKVYINAPGSVKLQDYWLLSGDDSVLRISIDDIRKDIFKEIKEFDSIILFNPCNEEKKTELARIFKAYKEEIMLLPRFGKEKYIVIKRDGAQLLSIEEKVINVIELGYK